MFKKVHSPEGIDRYADGVMVISEYNNQCECCTDFIKLYARTSFNDFEMVRAGLYAEGIGESLDQLMSSVEQRGAIIDVRGCRLTFPINGIQDYADSEVDVYEIKQDTIKGFEDQSDKVIDIHWNNFDAQKPYETLNDVDPRNQYHVLMKQFLTPMVNGEEKRMELADFLDGNYSKQTMHILRRPFITTQIAQSYANFIASVANQKFEAAINYQDQLESLMNE